MTKNLWIIRWVESGRMRSCYCSLEEAEQIAENQKKDGEETFVIS